MNNKEYVLLHSGSCADCVRLAMHIEEMAKELIQLEPLNGKWHRANSQNFSTNVNNRPALVQLKAPTYGVYVGPMLVTKLSRIIGIRNSWQLYHAARTRPADVSVGLSRRAILRGGGALGGAALLGLDISGLANAAGPATVSGARTLVGSERTRAYNRLMTFTATKALDSHQIRDGRNRISDGYNCSEVLIDYKDRNNNSIRETLQPIEINYTKRPRQGDSFLHSGKVFGVQQTKSINQSVGNWRATVNSGFTTEYANPADHPFVFRTDSFCYRKNNVEPDGYYVSQKRGGNRRLYGPNGNLIYEQSATSVLGARDSLVNGTAASECSKCEALASTLISIGCGISGIVLAAVACGPAAPLCATIAGFLLSIYCSAEQAFNGTAGEACRALGYC